MRRWRPHGQAVAAAIWAAVLAPLMLPLVMLSAAALAETRDQKICDGGSGDAAIAACTRAIATGLFGKHELAQLYDSRASAYRARHEYERAIADFDQALKLEPDNLDAYIGRGLVWFDRGDFERALRDEDAAIKIKPTSPSPLLNRCLIDRRKRDPDRAIADANKAFALGLSEFGTNVFYDCRGGAFYDKGNYDRAIADLTQAIRLDPKDTFALSMRAAAYCLVKDYDRCIADYTQLLKINPANASALYWRGRARQANGDQKGGDADIIAARKIDPDIGK